MKQTSIILNNAQTARTAEKVKRLVNNIRFWVWAAMHDSGFESFRIGFTRIIKVNVVYQKHASAKLVVSASFFIPEPTYYVTYVAAARFTEATKACSVDDLMEIEDDIPF
ncbi:hypothetical protein CAL7716_072390 [Calothrix sp. PCC 7716]|nr:hypothetical protein CAL7716_072390 [Calothrix sp. PCC 7716]